MTYLQQLKGSTYFYEFKRTGTIYFYVSRKRNIELQNYVDSTRTAISMRGEVSAI